MELVLIDTAQIQSYIFNSNRLREHIGASHLVDAATTALVYNALLTELSGAHNVMDVEASGLKLDPAKKIEASDIRAEVIYAGGGNVAILFEDEGEAILFRRRLTASVIERVPGISVVTAQETVVDNKPGPAYKSLLKALTRNKSIRKGAGMLRGISVTRWDRSSGEPVVGLSPENAPVAASTREKINVTWGNAPDARLYMGARDRLEQYIKPPEGFEYPVEFDHLGRTEGRHSYIAIVHADGDGMGQRLRAYIDERMDADLRKFVDDLRKFSLRTGEAAQKALNDMFSPLSKLLESYAEDPVKMLDLLEKENPLLKEVFEYLTFDKKEQKWRVPFRPVVYGGDDVTFVCDGRLGLTLATAFCAAFKKHAAAIPGPSAGEASAITASAGVCIVKSHYPFAQAYHLAEDLAQSAKKLGRKMKLKDPSGCIDWHFARSGLSGDLDVIRSHEYNINHKMTLLQRPVSLGKAPSSEPYRTWQTVANTIKAFRDFDQGWVGRRSKMKEVFETFRQGEDAMKVLTRANRQPPQLELPNLNLPIEGYRDTGFSPAASNDSASDVIQRALYFDALELVDWHILLD